MKKTQILIITLLVTFSSRSQNYVKMDEAKSAAVCFAIKENLAGNLTNTRFDTSVKYLTSPAVRYFAGLLSRTQTPR